MGSRTTDTQTSCRIAPTWTPQCASSISALSSSMLKKAADTGRNSSQCPFYSNALLSLSVPARIRHEGGILQVGGYLRHILPCGHKKPGETDPETLRMILPIFRPVKTPTPLIPSTRIQWHSSFIDNPVPSQSNSVAYNQPDDFQMKPSLVPSLPIQTFSKSEEGFTPWRRLPTTKITVDSVHAIRWEKSRSLDQCSKDARNAR